MKPSTILIVIARVYWHHSSTIVCHLLQTLTKRKCGAQDRVVFGDLDRFVASCSQRRPSAMRLSTSTTWFRDCVEDGVHGSLIRRNFSDCSGHIRVGPKWLFAWHAVSGCWHTYIVPLSCSSVPEQVRDRNVIPTNLPVKHKKVA